MLQVELLALRIFSLDQNSGARGEFDQNSGIYSFCKEMDAFVSLD